MWRQGAAFLFWAVWASAPIGQCAFLVQRVPEPQLRGQEKRPTIFTAAAVEEAEQEAVEEAREEAQDDPPPLFLTEEDLPRYGVAVHRYLSAKGCLAKSRGDPALPRRKLHGRCAVVGASPNSRDSKAGASIDGHDAVFRAGICDASTLSEYGADIGQKITYCVSFKDRSDLPPHARLMMPLTTWDFLLSVKSDNKSGAPGSCRDRFLPVHPRFLASSDATMDAWGRSAPPVNKSVAAWRAESQYVNPDCLAQSTAASARSCPNIIAPSSGFEAVLLAMELCKTVDVYGFDTDVRAEAAYGHLQNDISAVGSCKMVEHRHPFPLERHFLKRLDDLGLLWLHNSTRLPATLGAHSSGC